MKIQDFKATYKDLDTALRASAMFELRKQISFHVLDGKFKQARQCQQQLAKYAVEDFDTYKSLPFIHVTMQMYSLKETLELAFNTFKFKLLSKFSKKTPEEKQLLKLGKEYYGKMTKKEIKDKTIDITI